MIKIPIHKGANSYKTRVVKIQNYRAILCLELMIRISTKSPLESSVPSLTAVSIALNFYIEESHLIVKFQLFLTGQTFFTSNGLMTCVSCIDCIRAKGLL